MRNVSRRWVFTLCAMGLFLPLAIGAEKAKGEPVVTRNISYENELQHAIDRGLRFLVTNQNANGWWSTEEHPAVTALVLTAFKGDPSGKYSGAHPQLDKGYAYLLSCVQPDGGIHRSNLVTYNTSISMLGLMAANKRDYEPVVLKARERLVSLQRDFGAKGAVDTVFDGGVGYGSKYEHSDMGNTAQALEALYYSKRLLKDRPPSGEDLNWDAAIAFLQSCQNLPGHNTQSWASADPRHKGGFIYYPGHSMAGGETNESGRVTLRSYGSISYAGLLSYIYADLKKDDQRVTAVYDWLRGNYTLEENPGMGAQGLYYYFHTMAKALAAYGVEQLELTNGRSVAWRKDLSRRLLDLQQKDGSWVNDNGRWWEKDPALVTAYGVLTMEIILRGMQSSFSE